MHWQAVREDYYFQMVYDDLPFWGFIGKPEKLLKQTGTELKYFVFTHVHFDISFNKDRVIEIKVTTDPSHTVCTHLYQCLGITALSMAVSISGKMLSRLDKSLSA